MMYRNDREQQSHQTATIQARCFACRIFRCVVRPKLSCRASVIRGLHSLMMRMIYIMLSSFTLQTPYCTLRAQASPQISSQSQVFHSSSINAMSELFEFMTSVVIFGLEIAVHLLGLSLLAIAVWSFGCYFGRRLGMILPTPVAPPPERVYDESDASSVDNRVVQAPTDIGLRERRMGGLVTVVLCYITGIVEILRLDMNHLGLESDFAKTVRFVEIFIVRCCLEGVVVLGVLSAALQGWRWVRSLIS
nr:hypothetical protein CFP56_13218 [Quercus suber]